MILFTNAKKFGNLMVLIEPHLIIRYRYLFFILILGSSHVLMVFFSVSVASLLILSFVYAALFHIKRFATGHYIFSLFIFSSFSSIDDRTFIYSHYLSFISDG
jgi:hypothetical protein